MKSSVAIATYNGACYLEEQLDSLRLQTVRPDEVVIFDDGSTDGTVEMARSYIERFDLSGWRVTRNQKNLGFAENFHTAIRACSGDIVFFCDQDDVWYPNKIERCLKTMGDRLDIALLCSEFDLLMEHGATGSIPGACARAMTGDGSLEAIPAHGGGVYIWLGCAMAVRKSFLDTIEPYWVPGWAHDECVWKLAQAADGCYLLHEPLLGHRMHGSNTTGHKIHNREKRVVHLRKKMEGDFAAARFASDMAAKPSVVNLFSRIAECEKLRLELVENRKLTNAIRLIGRLPLYQEKRSYLRELFMAVKG